jgi:hypothetical protein
VDVTPHAPLRSRWTNAVPVYHVRVIGNADSLPSPSKDTTLYNRRRGHLKQLFGTGIPGGHAVSHVHGEDGIAGALYKVFQEAFGRGYFTIKA